MSNAVSNLLLFDSRNFQNASLCLILISVWGLCVFQDKAPYIANAEKKRMEYKKAINAYNKKVVMAFYNTNLVITSYLSFYYCSATVNF